MREGRTRQAIKLKHVPIADHYRDYRRRNDEFKFTKPHGQGRIEIFHSLPPESERSSKPAFTHRYNEFAEMLRERLQPEHNEDINIFRLSAVSLARALGNERVTGIAVIGNGDTRHDGRLSWRMVGRKSKFLLRGGFTQFTDGSFAGHTDGIPMGTFAVPLLPPELEDKLDFARLPADAYANPVDVQRGAVTHPLEALPGTFAVRSILAAQFYMKAAA